MQPEFPDDQEDPNKLVSEPGPSDASEASEPTDPAPKTSSPGPDTRQSDGGADPDLVDEERLMLDDDKDKSEPLTNEHDASGAIDAEGPVADPGGPPTSDTIVPADEGASPDDPSSFLDLIADTGSWDPNESIAQLAPSEPPPSFTGIDHEPGTQPTPGFRVVLNASDLMRVDQLLTACTAKGRERRPIRLSINCKQLKVQAFPDAFFEFHIQPLSIIGIDDNVKAVLIIRGDDFRTTYKALGDIVELRYVPGLKILHVSSDNFERPIPLQPETLLPALNDKFIGTIDFENKQMLPAALAEAIKYVAPHVVTDDVQEHLSVIDCRGDTVIGGTRHVIARFKSADLTGIDLCFRGNYADLVLLTISGVEQTTIYETEYFTVFRTSDLVVGVPKSHHRSKMFDLLIEPDCDERLIVSRKSMMTALDLVEHSIGSTLVRMRIMDRAKTKLRLYAAGDNDVVIQDALDAHSTFEKCDVRVSNTHLAIASKKETSPNIVLHVVHNALIVDDSDERRDAMTFIALSPAGAKPTTLALDDHHEFVSAEEP